MRIADRVFVGLPDYAIILILLAEIFFFAPWRGRLKMYILYIFLK
jgi:hypothetical protein